MTANKDDACLDRSDLCIFGALLPTPLQGAATAQGSFPWLHPPAGGTLRSSMPIALLYQMCILCLSLHHRNAL